MDDRVEAVQGLALERLPRGRFLSRFTERLLDRHGRDGLRSAVVLVPDLHASADVAAALRQAARQRVLLLPRITTMRAWAEEVPLARPLLGDAARAALLYGALAARGWFAPADLWTVCAELGRLFDELTRERVRLAASPAEFAAWLKEAYGAAGGRPLDFEARLVQELWSALASDGGSLDRESAYIARLAHLATDASAAVHLVAPGRCSRAEREFLVAYAARAPVTAWLVDDTLEADACARLLAAAWPAASAPPLKARAEELREREGSSGIAGRLRLAAADGAEHEARIVDLAVRERLLAGKRRIAIVVQDRITARRARALLERAGVLVSDEAGWAVSTTSAATVLARWLDALSGNFYHRDVLDLLKSPFVFAQWPREQRQRAVWRLEQRIRADNAIAGLDRYIAVAEDEGDAEVRQMLATLRSAAALLQRGRASLSRWLALLLESLDAIGVLEGWAADAAGVQLLELLEGLREQLRTEQLSVPFGEWRNWLAAELDNAAFRDQSVSSPVVFTYLRGVALRRFDAVVIAGADAAHLPGPDTGSAFFNQAVRAQLGLPTRADTVRETEAALRDLVAGCDDVVATWQRMRDGEANLLAPALERLEGLHRIAYGTGLHDEGLAARANAAAVRHAGAAAGEVGPSARPAPAVLPELVPQVMSASAHNALMACPYQFYARYVLKLGELDEVQELIEKGDYGIRVHLALADFHKAHPRVTDLAEDDAVRALEACSEAAFRDAVGTNYLARAWLERWRALIPGYLGWQRKRESEGWQVAESEVARSLDVVTPAGHHLQLKGRIDRVDRNARGEAALVDYKTQRRERLRAKLDAEGEDVQLPFYALLWREPVAEALFLGMERDGVSGHAAPGDVNELAAVVHERLGRLYDRMRAGAAFPAHGVDDACEYCEAAGLCRKRHWP